MSGRDSLRIDDVRRIGLPDFCRSRIAMSADAAGRAPEQKHGTLDFAARREIFSVHFQIDASRSTVILADRVNGCRISKAAFVFSQCILVEKAEALFGFCKLLLDEPIGVGTHHSLRQIERLNIEEPMPGEGRPWLVAVV